MYWDYLVQDIVRLLCYRNYALFVRVFNVKVRRRRGDWFFSLLDISPFRILRCRRKLKKERLKSWSNLAARDSWRRNSRSTFCSVKQLVYWWWWQCVWEVYTHITWQGKWEKDRMRGREERERERERELKLKCN